MANSVFKFLSKAEITAVFARFQKANPAPKTELLAPNDFTFLVSVVLSAQSTDASVNKATPALFALADTPQKMAALGEEKIAQYIKTIGLYRSKARHIVALSAQLCDMGYDGKKIKLPRSRQELMKLAGVGQKTANVVLNVLYGEHTMPVDTHILRISVRIGLSDKTTPEGVEKDLLMRIPYAFMESAHHWLILHGRYICTARKPACKVNFTDCPISDICKKNGLG